MQRVVVTGYGAVTPFGLGVTPLWSQVIQGKSAIRRIDEDYGLKTCIAGKVTGLIEAEHFTSKTAKCYDPFIQYGIIAAREAYSHSGLSNYLDLDKQRVAVVVGSGIGGIAGIQEQCTRMIEKSPRRVSPFFIPSTLVNMVSGFISMDLGLKGPNYSVVSACATGAHSIITAYQALATNMADVVMAGGAEYGSTRLGMAGFSVMRALSTRNDEPERASRPWDVDRDGFVMSDGAGVLVLETLEHALRRGAPIMAELVGVGMNSDAHHMTQPDPHGEGAVRCMRMGMDMAKLTENEVGYINAHATSTPLGDENEPRAIRSLFKAYAYDIPVSASKSMLGHMLGAAGAVEAIITIKSLKEQMCPPTINCETPSEGCDLDFVRDGARKHAFDYALTNSFGFGGTNACLVFSNYNN